jgi:UDP-2-acetamido-3-amino-2,3-dideoxy-glucuronate N-acetyltransferase
MFHPTALVESEEIGDQTRIWAYAHVMAGAKIGRNCNIGDHAFIERGAVIGDNVTIKNGVCVWEGVEIGSGAFVGPQAVFTNDPYPRSPRLPIVQERYAGKAWLRTTRIGEGATIGAAAVILCGVTIGAYAFIAAGALVLENVPPQALYLGAPAQQRGWVCLCGRPMRRDGALWICPECAREYEEEESVCGSETRRSLRERLLAAA